MSNPAGKIIGGLLIWLCFAFILYGITAIQTFIYFQKDHRDKAFLRVLVATVWILETVHTAFCMEYIYAYLVEGFGDYGGFLSIDWGIGVVVVVGSGIALCVHGYYVWRIWVVSGKSLIPTVAIGTLALLRVAAAVLAYIYPTWDTFRHTKISLIAVSGGLGSGALVDMLVALMLTYYLKRGRHTWHRESNTMIKRILIYAVNTGAITGAVSLLCVILFAVEKSSLVFLGLVMVQGKLYANSLLGSLNARSHIRGKGSVPPYPSSNNFYVTSARPSRIRPVEVFQHTVVHDDSVNTMGSGGDFDLGSMKE